MFQETIQKLLEKTERNGLRFDGKIPQCWMQYDGTYRLYNGGGWTDSFWVGIFYLAYAYTNDKKYLSIADKYQEFFRHRVVNTDESCQKYQVPPLDHDIGFLFSLTEVARYQLTQDPEAKEIALKAAEILKGRFNEKGGFIRAWNSWPQDSAEFREEKRGKMIIDCMMNIPLLYWAYEQTGDESFHLVAKTHADMVMKYIVREDYSTYHTYNFNPETGEPLGGRTQQGYSDQSCWSRGQAWAIYGFGLAYQAEKDPAYLKTAEGLVTYYVEHLGAGKMPAWDLEATQFPFCPWDSSAAAIAAAGVVQLAEVTSGEKAERYKALAKDLLTHLTGLCGTEAFKEFEPFLLHGSIGPNFQQDKQIPTQDIFAEQGLVYGDYFYLEALMRLEKPGFHTFWL